MTDLIFKAYDEKEIEKSNNTGLYFPGGMAFSDYKDYALEHGYALPSNADFIFGCVVESNDTQEDVEAFVTSAVLNPYVSIIMLQYPENEDEDDIDWILIENILRHGDFVDLKSYDKRLAYGRFTLI